MKRLALVIASCLAACQNTGNRATPKSMLEGSVYFHERDERGQTHPISALPAQNAEAPALVARVSDGATLDVNSKLMIDVLRSNISGTLDTAALDLLQAQADALTAALGEIAKFVDLQARSADAWTRLQALPEDAQDGTPEQATFIGLRQQRGASELSFLGPIRELWPRQSTALAAERARVEELVTAIEQDQDRTAAVSQLNTLLQSRVRSWNGAAERLEADTTKAIAARELRIEAFLVPGDKADKKQAVHVEGYDDLDEGEVHRIDPKGMHLSDEERARLTKLMAASKELAATLEKIRTGKAKWSEAFLDTRSAIVKRTIEAAHDLLTA